MPNELKSYYIPILGMPFEKIIETENVSAALDYLKRRQSTIRCLAVIEMLENKWRAENGNER